MRRANWIYLAAAALVMISGVSGAGAATPYNRFLKSLREERVTTPKANAAARQANAARRAAARRTLRTTTTTKPKVTTTTRKATTTTRATTTTSPPPPPAPVVAPPPAPPVPPPPTGAPCVGVAMTRGQADIDANPDGTTFCLSGVHNWTLVPKHGNKFIGPAVLDGGNTTGYAITSGWANNVVVKDLEIRNYRVGAQRGAIWIANNISGWTLQDLQVHDNGTSAGGAGANLGLNWRVIGGRYYNNRQTGLAGAGDGTIIDGVEIDHNNFTNNSYTARTIDCGYEGGGFKWVAKNVTVRNSSIHDNACKGLWSDGGTRDSVITNNHVYNNWNEGIFVEISSGATITGNNVHGNGFHSGAGGGCPWLYGGGITISSSDRAEIAGNTVVGNCNGITGLQQNRPDGNPGLLQHLSIHDNTISGPGGKTGVATDVGTNFSTRNIVFSNNAISNISFCNLTC